MVTSSSAAAPSSLVGASADKPQDDHGDPVLDGEDRVFGGPRSAQPVEDAEASATSCCPFPRRGVAPFVVWAPAVVWPLPPEQSAATLPVVAWERERGKWTIPGGGAPPMGRVVPYGWSKPKNRRKKN